MEKEREEKTLALSKEVKVYLADGTTEKKIWALRKIQLDTLLCKLLADDDRCDPCRIPGSSPYPALST